MCPWAWRNVGGTPAVSPPPGKSTQVPGTSWRILGEAWRGTGSCICSRDQGPGAAVCRPPREGRVQRPGAKPATGMGLGSGPGSSVPPDLTASGSRSTRWSPGEEDEGDRQDFPMIPREAVISKQTVHSLRSLQCRPALLCGGEVGGGGGGEGGEGRLGPQRSRRLPLPLCFRACKLGSNHS